MVTQEQELPQELDIETIQSQNWELPVCNLGKGKYEWRPGMAHLPYFYFDGPVIGRFAHGVDLNKDYIVSAHGPRGACKTDTISFLAAKKMRMGQPVWGNWPISFFVVEKDCYDSCELPNWRCVKCRKGHQTYYENSPLNFDKLYTFNTEIANGSVAITEMQYYAEARTSGRTQNRLLGYHLMQIRKSAMSFFYDVQNENWVDNRFRWSDDLEIHCNDVSKLPYEGEDIDEGAICHWKIRDMSGVATGQRYIDSKIEYGPFQFDAFRFWWIYPTKWKVDVYDAVYSLKQGSDKADKQAKMGKGIELALNYFIEMGESMPVGNDIWRKASELGGIVIPPVVGGKILSQYGLQKVLIKQQWHYDLKPLTDIEDGQ